MNSLRQRIAASPALARVLPFLLFAGITAFQDSFGETSRYWIYLGKTLIGAWAIWFVRPYVAEMKWYCSVEAVVVGIAVFGLWVGLDLYYPHFGAGAKPWNPLTHFGAFLAWFFIVVRIFGVTFVVPFVEEILYRSFLYRWIVQKDFQTVPLNKFNGRAFVVTSIVFGIAHPREWLAGIICGAAYQWLVIKKRRLGDAISAHAVTNLLLGIWVVYRSAWQFW